MVGEREVLEEAVTVLCIIPGPSHIYKTEPDDKPRWCFKCRKRAIHEWQLIGDSLEAVSYYDPQWVLRCPTCHGDHTCFPGTDYL